MSLPISAINLPYRMRCQLPDCKKPTQHIFRINIDGIRVQTCSPDHAYLAERRWEEKKKLNIRMGVPPEEKQEEYTGDNLDELQGGE